MKLVALDAATLNLPEAAWSPVAAHGALTFHELTPYEELAIVERSQGHDVVLTNKVPFSASTLQALPELKLIGVLATGYNIIDLAAAKAQGVTVCNVPAYSTVSVVQHTLALILELTNQAGLHAREVADGAWVRSPVFSFWRQAPVQLEGRTVGIVGWGDIGSRVGYAAHALGATVLGASRSRKNPPPWGPFAWAEIPEIFERADVISLHCPQTPETTHLVNQALLRRMKPTAVLVNTARGGLVNEADLAEALQAGRIGGAALDVISVEPMQADNPLRSAPNCLITPHMAWASLESRERLLAITAENIAKFQAGTPQNVVGG
ncbi:MAG: D-2-hydroxyacid dehydrogenase [Opitutales bacterium]